MPQPEFDVRLVDWCWSRFGGNPMLVTKTGGSKVVLSAFKSGRQAALCVRKSLTDGQLVEVTPEHPVARLLADVPELFRLCRLTAEGNDPETLRALAAQILSRIGEWKEPKDAEVQPI